MGALIYWYKFHYKKTQSTSTVKQATYLTSAENDSTTTMAQTPGRFSSQVPRPQIVDSHQSRSRPDTTVTFTNNSGIQSGDRNVHIHIPQIVVNANVGVLPDVDPPPYTG